jgi:hypothetical protein
MPGGIQLLFGTVPDVTIAIEGDGAVVVLFGGSGSGFPLIDDAVIGLSVAAKMLLLI